MQTRRGATISAAASRSRPPSASRPLCSRPEVLPPPAETPPDGTCVTCGGPPAPVVSPPVSGAGVTDGTGAGVVPGVALGDVAPGVVGVGVGATTMPDAVGTGVVGAAVGVVVGVGVDVGVGVGVAVAVGVPVGVGLGVAAAAAVTEVRTAARQVTVAPPPLLLPLHWLMVVGRAADCVDALTVHWTRIVAPPPLPLLLHWSTVALVVLPIGLHDVVGAVPPPVPLPLHWLTVAAAVVAAPVMVLVMSTVQRVTPPPPLALPLHWSTLVVGCATLVVLLVQVPGTFAAPLQTFTVTVESPTPVATSYRLVMVTSQATSWPPTLPTPLHCEMAAAALAAGAPRVSRPRDVAPANRARAARADRRERRWAWRAAEARMRLNRSVDERPSPGGQPGSDAMTSTASGIDLTLRVVRMEGEGSDGHAPCGLRQPRDIDDHRVRPAELVRGNERPHAEQVLRTPGLEHELLTAVRAGDADVRRHASSVALSRSRRHGAGGWLPG